METVVNKGRGRGCAPVHFGSLSEGLIIHEGQGECHVVMVVAFRSSAIHIMFSVVQRAWVHKNDTNYVVGWVA